MSSLMRNYRFTPKLIKKSKYEESAYRRLVSFKLLEKIPKNICTLAKSYKRFNPSYNIFYIDPSRYIMKHSTSSYIMTNSMFFY